MGRAPSRLVTLATLAALAGAAAAHDGTILRDVRVGAHPGFDRVVIELDGPADIAWERGPEPGAESFYLSADPIRTRLIKTKLARVGDVAVTPMRGGTRVLLEPHERRVRAYLLAKPPRLVIDVAPPGEGEFKAPAGVQALSPATAVAPQHPAPEPEPAPAPQPEAKLQPEAKPEAAPPPAPEAAPPPAPSEAAPQAEAPPEPAPPPQEAAPEPAPEAVPAPEPEAAPAPAPEAAPQAEEPPPAPPAPETEAVPPGGFPWAAVLTVLLGGAGLGALALAVRARAGRPRPRPVAQALRTTLNGVEVASADISADELRRASDAASVLEQRLDEEVRARVALEERLAEAGEELKVLRDRLYRIERKRDEAV